MRESRTVGQSTWLRRPKWVDEEPIRAEILSIERLEQQAAALAEEQEVWEQPTRGPSLLPRLEDNGRHLRAAYRTLVASVQLEQSISPAAEWLIDNFNTVEEQLRQIHQDLPESYYFLLPKLATGKLRGYPRIYELALSFTAHSDSLFDGESLKRIITAYQAVTPLTIGELWAVAIILRLALLENLRRLAAGVVARSDERAEADRLADSLLTAPDEEQRVAVTEVVRKLEARPATNRALVVQLAQRLRDQDPDLQPLVDWVERAALAQELTLEQIVQEEHRRQAAAQVTVGNIITSMQMLSHLDWRSFVESVSLLEPLLGADPAQVYRQMDFATRDRYRHVIEELARRTLSSELEVARAALDLAQEASRDLSQAQPQQSALTHIGYYLIDVGRAELERRLKYRPTPGQQLRRAALAYPTGFYFGSLALLTVMLLATVVAISDRAGATILENVVVALLALWPAADLAVSLLHLGVTHVFAPRVLPKLDATLPVPPSGRTMIVVPTMLTSLSVVEELVEKLEVHYLANQDDQFYFALLADFADADVAELPEDEVLLDAALAGIARLNARYAAAEVEDEGPVSPSPPRFALLQRSRQWNEAQGRWIAWERKRGKLEEFNRLLRGSTETSFVTCTAPAALLNSIRYVITLDSDTQLPREVAQHLVATIRHPLNQGQLDSEGRSILRGYAILQPRVSVTLESGARSQFARILSGSTGIDPYSTAASDVYQDLFAEGSFTGKGLYDVDAFQAVLSNRVPDNALLSHDLFEGLYARTALVSDIELLDETPAQFDTWAKRLHRWTRGDWQIARWLLPHVPNGEGKLERNTLSVLSRWKIFDNLRRSLVAPALLLLLVTAWLWLPGGFWWGTLFALLVVSFPVYAHVTTSLFTHPRGVPWTSYFWHIWSDFGTNTRQVGLTCAFLPHQAWLHLDAIVRTGYRQLISHRHLLEWVTAAQTERGRRHDQKAFWRLLYPVTLFAILVALALALWRPVALWPALPFLLGWAFAPLLAFAVSRPLRSLKEASRQLDDAGRHTLRLIARRTWRFFETFVGPDDHWLPPDNFQEDPRPLVAHRTSPTNIGLLLLATVAARDFGYLGLLELVERLELTLDSLSLLEKSHGHCFNWYDTQTRAPLVPQYISTVDSGNLAAHLVAVKQAALALPDESIFDVRELRGFLDTVALVRDEAKLLCAVKGRTHAADSQLLLQQSEDCFNRITRLIQTPGLAMIASVWAQCLAELTSYVSEMEDIARALEHEQGPLVAESLVEFHNWLNLLRNQTQAVQRDFDRLLPWEAMRSTYPTTLLERAAPEHVERWAKLASAFDRIPTTRELADRGATTLIETLALSADLAKLKSAEGRAAWSMLEQIAIVVARASKTADQLVHRANAVASTCDELVAAMDFGFLFDKVRQLFVIGYDVGSGRHDQSFYDLLASEARLTSLVAIAKGEVPQEHWFRLGRQSTHVDQAGRALVSWTATMFEYLMPLLVTYDYPETLLDQTYETVVARQIAYGREQGVPWGVSESAYNARDLQFSYQYGPFGVPGMGLKRGLSEDLVIAPYATMLATLIAPQAAVQNIERLAQAGALSRYGFYEALDYTPERVPQGQHKVLIRSFMAHHQGMSLVALDNLLNGAVMQHRFHADAMIQAAELLLQERIPRAVPVVPLRSEEVFPGIVVNTLPTPLAVTYVSPSLPTPRTQLLSNGSYSVLITSAGSGASWCSTQATSSWAVTRWREDGTRDNWGSFCYLRDVHSGMLWSSGYQPLCLLSPRLPEGYEVTFAEDRAVFERLDRGIHTRTEILVSPEDDAELRCVMLSNRSSRVREIELTSYAEIVLAPSSTDLAHAAFSNLFVETEFLAEEQALIAKRRLRSPHETPVFAVHTVTVEGEAIGSVQYETSRARFLGRGRDAGAPQAIIEDQPLSNTVGAVLDPIFSLRQRVRIEPGQTARVTFCLATAHSREHILMLADKYHISDIFARLERLAWTKAQIDLRHLNIAPGEAHLFQRLAGRVLYSDNSLRPVSAVLSLNEQPQSGLWKFGISGDLPLVLVRIRPSLNEMAELDMVRQILRGHEYLRLRGLAFDLVILNDHPPSYLQVLQDDIQLLLRSTGWNTVQDQPGGVFLLRSDLMTEQDKLLLHAVARVVLVTERGTLEAQLARRPAEGTSPPPSFAARRVASTTPIRPLLPLPNLQFFNGLGGFAKDGREYVTVLNEGQRTPAPWMNVIANELDFGFQVTESGGGHTWSVNSRENRLTPWSNDAISDPPGEVIYLRDEETGAVWTPTPLPIRETSAYLIRHGQGYSAFEHTSNDIVQELLLFVPLDATVKIARLRLRNESNRRRRLSVTSYNELVLGVSREKSAPFVITERDPISGALFARNRYNNEFALRVAFAAMNPSPLSATGDRKSFFGRNGHPMRPAALGLKRLDERFGAGHDPCLAMQSLVDLDPGETRDVIVLLGESEDAEGARVLASRFLQPEAVSDALERVVDYWETTLTAVEVRTPDPALNIMLNRWLLYQTLVCRLLARSAFYQSGGAYGFRDQLQDVMALVYSRPEFVRAHLLRAAAHQFKEGDVQHWWHPPTGRGVRTRISDDLLWLPYVTAFYVRVTGDEKVLDEVVPFIEAPLLAPGVEDEYLQPQASTEQASLYEHCLRAVDRSLAVGAHGLPLMGSGDWNDGMNRVGHDGKGESIWLGWFLFATVTDFLPFCLSRQEPERAARYRAYLTRLRNALEAHGWDGEWYKRAFFDDGSPLGSGLNEECRIDSVAQSWAVLSGAAQPERTRQALNAVKENLVRAEDGLVMLLTPPFDLSLQEPGYIKGYVPGVRENGGQYTHAAVWTLMAFAELRDGEEASKLFALLNPINHSATRAGTSRYRVEPYVMAGDVYAVPPHVGRGGWTWYTGAAAWMYRAGLESILGFYLEGDKLRVDPCIPGAWREFEVSWRRGETRYHLRVENPDGVSHGVVELELDGEMQPGSEVHLRDDALSHEIRVLLGEAMPAGPGGQQ
jgi:cyclic beta-1,2-glucan synthetase